jgi:hypothetical protein
MARSAHDGRGVGDLAAEYSELLAQYEDLYIFRRIGSGEQRDPAEHPQGDQVEQPQSHPSILPEPNHRVGKNSRSGPVT